MFLIDLWTRYLSKTMPTLSDFGVPLACFQMLGGLPSLFSLYRSVRRDSPWERVLLCMVPGIFIVTFAFIEPLFFGSFIGDGFPWVDALRHFLDQPAFFRETMVLSGVFFLLVALDLLLQRSGRQGQDSRRTAWPWAAVRHRGMLWLLKAGRFLLSVGAELAISLSLLLLGADYLRGRGQLFYSLTDTPLKWLIYGIYLVLYKSILLFVCSLWHLLFGERKQPEDGGVDYDRWLRRYLAHGYRAFGWGMLMFAGLWTFAVVGGLYREGSPYRWALAFDMVLIALGLGSLLASFLQPARWRILAWGNPELTLWQLHRELAELPPLVRTDIGFLTQHYLVVTMPYRQIFCRALLDRDKTRVTALGAYWLRFKDGGRCRIHQSYRQLLGPLIFKKTFHDP